MSKPLNTFVSVLAVLMVISGIGLYIFRYSLLEALLNDQLGKQGIPLQSIEIVDLSFNALQIHDLAAGTQKEFRVDKVLINWDLSDLLVGKPISIEIAGLNIVLDLSKQLLSEPMKPMSSEAGKDWSIPWLPVLSLRDSAIHLHSPAGNQVVALSGNITYEPSGVQMVNFSAITSGSLGHFKSMLSATLDAQKTIQGKFTVSEGMLSLTQAEVASFEGEVGFALTALHPQHIQTEWMLSGIRLLGAQSTATVAESADDRPALEWDDFAIDHMTLKGDIRGSPLAGTLDIKAEGGRLVAKPVNIQQMSVALPVRVDFSRDALRAGLRNPARIQLGKIDSDYDLGIKDSLDISISRADFEWADNTLKHDLAVTAANFTLLAKQQESPAIEARIQLGTIRVSGQLDANKNYQGQAAISDAGVHLPQSHWNLKAISANAHLGNPLDNVDTNEIARFTIGQIHHQVPEPLIKTVSISGNLEDKRIDGKSKHYEFNVAGGVRDLRYFKLTGKHAIDSGQGMLKVQVVPLRFSPNGLQPGALFPILDSLDDVSGVFNASAQMAWSKQGITSNRGKVKLHDISFAHEAAKVSDLNATLNLNNVLSPSSLPRQTITARSIDPGIPLQNLLISYQIQQAEVPRIALEKMRFSTMDGMVSLEPTIFNPASDRSELLVRIDNINLATFFDLIKVQGLTGSGHLAGNIPITLENDQVLITNGHLEAKAPGILRFQSEKATQLLSGAGEEMNLLLQAMEDFHYSELSLHLDKSVSQDLIAKLSLLGNNPNVKDGQPFRLNIKLETDIDKILDTINQGYNLSHEILRGSLRLY